MEADNEAINEPQTRIKKAEKQKYVDFIQNNETQEVLKSIPKQLWQKYLREGFLNQTGLRISEYTHYKVMKAISNKQTLGGKTFVII
jgi:hypothetical protein